MGNAQAESVARHARYFRRAVGFTIKIDERIHAVAHDGRQLALSPDELRAWMALDKFQPWKGDARLIDKLEAHDLVYWSDVPDGRPTTGAPIGPCERVSLRDGIGVTVALADEDEIAAWPFMARRGSLDGKRLHGIRFSSAERGQEVYSVDFYRGAEIRHALPHLAYDPLLDACALLAPFDKPPMPDSYLMWLGHAGAVIRAGNATVVVDPLAIRRSDPPKPYVQAPFDWRALPPIDAIAITHADNDHFNPGTLARLPPHVPVIVPALVRRQPYQVDMERALRLLDFRHVVQLADWQSHAIGDVRITAVPFHGEDWGLSLQKATYVVEGPQGRVYLSADSLNPPELFDEVRTRLGTVDFAFLGVSGCEEPLVAPAGFGYGEFYADWLPKARRNQWQRFTMGPRQAADAARRLQCTRAFGYAAGGGSFMDMAHADEGTHTAFARLLGSAACELPLGTPVPIR